MDIYTRLVIQYPLLSAAIQFAILGTLGEIISFSLQKKRFCLPCKTSQILAKTAAWALLGVIIKYGFVGMKGFTSTLISHHLLPQFMDSGIGWAFAVSALTNIFFGPQMMLFHRLEDNLINWEWQFEGLTKAWWTLIWFWIPAHTITFSLPKEYQIGLAAVWAVVLGVIMGYSKQKSNPAGSAHNG